MNRKQRIAIIVGALLIAGLAPAAWAATDRDGSDAPGTPASWLLASSEDVWVPLALVGLVALIILIIAKAIWNAQNPPCPKCRKRGTPIPQQGPRGESGAACHACGEWFPDVTWTELKCPD